MSSMQGWFSKACNLLASTWRTQGAPDSDEVASEDFLKQLSAEYTAKTKHDGAKPEWPAASSQHITSITVDEEDFDCRVGKRAQKRRREAHTVGDTKQKPSGTKGSKRKKTKLTDAKGVVKTRAAQKAAGKVVEKDRIMASMIPQGWKIVAETGSGGFVGYSACLTWDGVEIRGFDGVKRYCKELGIQLPKKNSIMPQIEKVEPDSAEQVHRWILEAGRRGCLPAGSILPLAAIRARQKGWQGLPIEEILDD